ncbi:MAG: hypothetical protein E7126_03985 [Rikenellaceae bacterium]|nr:hypothetical protein [Rikenellaceae bacterium]
MKFFKNYIVVCVITILSIGGAFAQNDGEEVMRDELDRIFRGLNKNMVPTGLLLDYAIEYTDVRAYNGKSLTDSTLVDRHTFTNILRTLRSSVVNNQTNPIPYDIWGDVERPINRGGKVTLISTLFKYNSIKENALQDNLISYRNGTVYDNFKDGVWINPYNQSYAFAFAPSSEIYTNSNISFTLLHPIELRNCNFSKLYFDAGDGLGYRFISPYSTGDINVVYATDGLKTLRLRAVMHDGEVLNAHCQIFIASEYNVILNGTEDPDEQFIMREFTSVNGSVSANVAIKLASNNGITKPFIVVEGFDPVGLNLLNADDLFGATRYDEFYSDYLDNGLNPFREFDYIYIDWYNSTADIRQNAYLLIDIIEYINNIKTTSEPLVIVGQSMGGLVTRYALRFMELANKPHYVSTFISQDVPHLGANVPLGLIYCFHQLICCLNENDHIIPDKFTKDILYAYYNILHSDAAKQMLINYVDVDGNLDNSIHNDWQNTLNELGFPRGDCGRNIENLAIINGATYQINEDLINDKYLLSVDGKISSNFWSTLIVNHHLNNIIEDLVEEQIGGELTDWQKFRLAFNKTSLDVNAKVQPMWKNISRNDPLSTFNLHLKKTIKFLDCEINKTLYDSVIAIPNSVSLCYDDCCGSIYNIDKGISDFYDKFYLNTKEFNFDFSKNILFIPSCSALSISNITQNLLYADFYNDYSTLNFDTPFDAFFVPDEVEHHIIDTGINSFVWAYKQMRMKIEGPAIVPTTATFTVSGLNLDDTITWTSSDPTIAEFEENGKLVAKGNGFVTITAETYRGGELFRKQRTVKVGMPEFCITKQYYPNVGYEFTATVTDSEAEFINDLVASGEVNFEWKIIDSDGVLNDVESSGATATYMIAEDELVTIAVSLITSEGEKSPTRTLTINLQTPFSVNYKYVVIDSVKRVYWVKEDGTYEVGVHTEDLTFTFRNLALGSEDNILSLANKYIKGNKCYIGYNDEGNNVRKTLEGDKVSGEYKWTFPFFDLDIFCNAVSVGLIMNGNNSAVISNYEMVLLNTNYDLIQEVPFAVLYKPVFPEPLTPPIQLNPIVD